MKETRSRRKDNVDNDDEDKPHRSNRTLQLHNMFLNVYLD